MGISPNLGWQNNFEVLGAFWAVSTLDISLKYSRTFCVSGQAEAELELLT